MKKECWEISVTRSSANTLPRFHFQSSTLDLVTQLFAYSLYLNHLPTLSFSNCKQSKRNQWTKSSSDVHFYLFYCQSSLYSGKTGNAIRSHCIFVGWISFFMVGGDSIFYTRKLPLEWEREILSINVTQMNPTFRHLSLERNIMRHFPERNNITSNHNQCYSVK